VTEIVGVRFKKLGKIYFFEACDIEFKKGQNAIVETARRVEYGEVAISNREIDETKLNSPLKKALRIANEEDDKIYKENEAKAKDAFEVCVKKIKEHKLDMKLIDVEYTFDSTKLLFYFTADTTIDFRDLVKDLASIYRTRIELRQIGSRDKAKLIGGVGLCGLPLCCATFLNEFDGISINRAKNQMLAINIPKLSGHCGKLLCCLKYEDDAYTELKKGFPPVGTKVFIDKVEYEVTAINVVSKMVKIDNPGDSKFLSLEEFMKQTHYRPRPPRDDKDNNKPQNNQNNQNNKQKNNNKNEAR
jgi:cell fate regulator YaaT (PSP1 superfamily)